MERAKLIVKNFGPLKDIEIEVREMVTFIGAQASGKSTLAKLLSILEDESFRIKHNLNFETELEKYNILSYLNKDSYINYKSSEISIGFFDFEYSNGEWNKNGIRSLISSIKKVHIELKKTNKKWLVEKKNR
jgi:predicted ATPase